MLRWCCVSLLLALLCTPSLAEINNANEVGLKQEGLLQTGTSKMVFESVDTPPHSDVPPSSQETAPMGEDLAKPSGQEDLTAPKGAPTMSAVSSLLRNLHSASAQGGLTDQEKAIVIACPILVGLAIVVGLYAMITFYIEEARRSRRHQQTLAFNPTGTVATIVSGVSTITSVEMHESYSGFDWKYLFFLQVLSGVLTSICVFIARVLWESVGMDPTTGFVLSVLYSSLLGFVLMYHILGLSFAKKNLHLGAFGFFQFLMCVVLDSMLQAGLTVAMKIWTGHGNLASWGYAMAISKLYSSSLINYYGMMPIQRANGNYVSSRVKTTLAMLCLCIMAGFMHYFLTWPLYSHTTPLWQTTNIFVMIASAVGSVIPGLLLIAIWRYFYKDVLVDREDALQDQALDIALQSTPFRDRRKGNVEERPQLYLELQPDQWTKYVWSETTKSYDSGTSMYIPHGSEDLVVKGFNGLVYHHPEALNHIPE